MTRTLLGVPSEAPSDWLERLQKNAFFRPDSATTGVAEIGRLGGFRGFGGPFLTPPSLGRAGGRIVAFDRESAWEVHADGFGALLRRTAVFATEGQKARKIEGAVALLPGGEVRAGTRSAKFRGLSGAAHAQSEGPLLAVALPDSHYVYLVADVGGPC